MAGLFITFEGTEGSGKSTQISRLAAHLRQLGYLVRTLREPGGTPVGEEIRHTLKHSAHNEAMTSETELLLMMASRAQLVREVIRPALAKGEIVLCDRFYDSTIAYQGYGRGLDVGWIRTLTDFAVGPTRPQLTLLLLVSAQTSQARRRARQTAHPLQRDRIEQAEEEFFERVARGYESLAREEPGRVRTIDASGSVDEVASAIWAMVAPFLADVPVASARRTSNRRPAASGSSTDQHDTK